MVRSTIAGFPRFGPNRELKWALEGFWSGRRSEAELLKTAADLRLANWTLQQEAGLDLVPVNDFSLYDHVLDTSALFGAVPERYGPVSGQVSLDQYFAMARGRAKIDPVTALDMTKWFDANYHYLVPELHAGQTFALTGTKPVAELTEATAAGFAARPVIVGPLTYLALSHTTDGSDPLQLLDALLPAYVALVRQLAEAGATTIQFDEPILATDRFDANQEPLTRAYTAIAAAAGTVETWVTVPFGDPGASWDALINLPVSGIGLDLTRDLTAADIAQRGFPTTKVLIAGIVDGRNIWANDLEASLDQLEAIATIVGPEQLVVSTACSLLHVPYDVTLESELDPAVQRWLAFARQKVDEVVTLTRGLAEGKEAITAELATSRAIRQQMTASPARNVASVRTRVRTIAPTADQRSIPFAQRRTIQAAALNLPELPTTTIGSFPQTPALRNARRAFDRAEIDLDTYEAAIEASIRETIAAQEAIGLDVLVHGEPERNDMVQYFGEQLDGFLFTHHGWVQSYGSRMVRPPIILGDISRPHPMTVHWATFAQSLSDRPVKGMLTGPVTILNWSFVRDDQPRAETCLQIALAIRDEVADLEAAGIQIIQIDEPALREGLPLRRQNWTAYLDWATACFRISAGIARPETQIHTHMCYSAFGDVIAAISALDADVISIENARSDLEMLRVFSQFGYDKGVGPGVYDIHSPRVPATDEIVANLEQTLSLLNRNQIWINPDCGLKTRNWTETIQALTNMVAAAQLLRIQVPVG